MKGIIVMEMSGIYSQFGFEYQKEVFINSLLMYFKSETKAFYERDDDVSIGEYDEKLTKTICDSDILIQCKSGTISHDILVHVFCNWLLALCNQKKFVLFLENNIDFTYSEQSIKDSLISKIKSYPNGKKPNRGAILYKLKEKYYDKSTSTIKTELISDLACVYKAFNVNIKSSKELYESSKKKFTAEYSATLEIESARSLRFDTFRDNIYILIRDELLKKNYIEIEYKDYWRIIEKSIHEVTDQLYNPSFIEFQKKHIDKIETIKKALKRETDFFEKIGFNDEYIIDLLINEMYYKLVKDHYVFIKQSDLTSLAESIAKENYLRTKIKIQNDIQDLFLTTISQQIKAEIILNSKMQTGCYIFLSGDDADDECFIDWSGFNAR